MCYWQIHLILPVRTLMAYRGWKLIFPKTLNVPSNKFCQQFKKTLLIFNSGSPEHEKNHSTKKHADFGSNRIHS